jgi:hypothetical protein
MAREDIPEVEIANFPEASVVATRLLLESFTETATPAKAAPAVDFTVPEAVQPQDWVAHRSALATIKKRPGKRRTGFVIEGILILVIGHSLGLVG